jgi:hypothetical protein
VSSSCGTYRNCSRPHCTTEAKRKA